MLMLLYFVLKKNQKAKIFLYLAFSILVVFSNPFLFNHVIEWWEGPLENQSELKDYDGLILLGGLSSYQEEAGRIVFNSSADRLLQAMDLYKKRKVNYFVFTGGSALILKKEKKEGDFLKEYLINMGVKEDSLLMEAQSRNTHENAKFTYEVLKENKLLNAHFLLVTSAFHMKRALACFQKEGIDVRSYKTNPITPTRPQDFADSIIPSASVLSSWEQLMKEWIGFVAYRIKGYV